MYIATNEKKGRQLVGEGYCRHKSTNSQNYVIRICLTIFKKFDVKV